MDKDEFKSIRISMAMTQKQLAEALGFKNALSISHMETGFRIVSTRTAKALLLLQKNNSKNRK